jgi:CelD/BcsL family acetyltransferase involved in cellulose biosynthesis
VGASLLQLDDLTESDIGAWRDLSETAVEPNPFFDPDFVLPAAAELDPRGVGLLVARRGEEWIGCMPVQRTRGWRRVPATGLVAWRNLYCFLGTPLLSPREAEEGAAELVREGIRHGGFLGLDLLATDGPAGRALELAFNQEGLRPVSMRRFERATLARRPEQTYLALKPKHRRNFERLRRRMEDQLGGELTLRDRANDPDGWAEFLEVEASGWKGSDGTATAFAPIGHGPLFTEICRRLAPRGMLQLISAEANGVTAAMLCNLIAGDTAFTFKIAAAAPYLEYSPGIQIEIAYLDHFHSNERLSRVDSCAEPGNEMINRLWPDQRELGILAIPRRGLTGATARPLLKGTAWLRERTAGSLPGA